MNIFIPDSWLRDFLKSDASPKEVAIALSAGSLNVERIKEIGTDTVYEIETTPNRYDCLSVLGIAREAAAVLVHQGKKAKFSEERSTIEFPAKPTLSLNPSISNSELCPRFCAFVIDGVKIQPSDAMIVRRLEKAGLRSLNNVIDATNYIMLESGQPLHAFDFDKLAGTGPKRTMNLRESRTGEELRTLDGKLRKLPAGSIVIDDGEKLIDLCGIMGGENSAIGQKTTRVILFSQIYDPLSLRQTSKSLAHRTEAVLRFEKGLDPERVLPALYSVAKIILKDGGDVASTLYNINSNPFQPHNVVLTLKKLNQYLGIVLEIEAINGILSSLGFNLVESSKTECRWQVPSWRDKDVAIEEDLIEEVARIYGYDKLPTTLPKGSPPSEVVSKQFENEKMIKIILRDLGFVEVYGQSLIPKMLAVGGELQLTNPLSEDQVYLRRDLIPSLIAVAEENKIRFPKLKIFEMANVYLANADGNQLPKEIMTLAALFTCDGNVQEGINRARGIYERILSEFNIPANQTLTLGANLGKIKDNLFGFQIPLESLWKSISQRPFQLPGNYPDFIEDLSFFVDATKPFSEVEAIIKQAGKPLLNNLQLIDHFTNEETIKRGEKSFTFRLIYSDSKRSLCEKDIAPLRQNIIKTLESAGAKIRTNH